MRGLAGGPVVLRLGLGIQLSRRALEVAEQRRAEPPLDPSRRPAVPMAPVFLSYPLQLDGGAGERGLREDEEKALLRVRDLPHGLLDHLRNPADEGLLVEPDPGIIENPHAVPAVRSDDEQ